MLLHVTQQVVQVQVADSQNSCFAFAIYVNEIEISIPPSVVYGMWCKEHGSEYVIRQLSINSPHLLTFANAFLMLSDSKFVE